MINKKQIKIGNSKRTMITVGIKVNGNFKRCEFVLTSSLMSAVRSRAMKSIWAGKECAEAWESAYKWIVGQMKPVKKVFAHLVEMNENFAGASWYQAKHPFPFRFTSSLRPVA